VTPKIAFRPGGVCLRKIDFLPGVKIADTFSNAL
jgi:hypothetical protein